MQISVVVVVHLTILISIVCFEARFEVRGEEEEEEEEASTIWLLNSNYDSIQNESRSEKLTQLLARTGPNLRAAADYNDFSDVSLEESIEAWQLLAQKSQWFAVERLAKIKGKILKLLLNSNASDSCKRASLETLNSLENLDSWSTQMWSSTGNFPPIGLMDGQFTSLGSYHGCLNVQVPEWAHFRFTSYCVMAFRPVVTSRPRNHMTFQKLPLNLRMIFNETSVFRTFLDSAQYFYYLYMKIGVCVPSVCSPEDAQRISQTVGNSLSLMTGPAKCYTRAPPVDLPSTTNDDQASEDVEDEPVLIELSRNLNVYQIAAAILVITFFSLVSIATIWHAIELTLLAKEESLNTSGLMIFLRSISFNYFSAITNFREFIYIHQQQPRANEIKCLHGLRVFTMIWIICVHCLQYNSWDGFTRIFENVSILQDILMHPIYNASYVVDNFFFMSGLLAAYNIWCQNRQSKHHSETKKFKLLSSLIGRYLRLTPQVLLISLLYILLPLLGEGPFWFDMTHYSAKYCEKNWWINLIHLQAFYKKEEICNLVSWWISIDMFFYLIALVLIYMILNNYLVKALISTCLIMTIFTCIAAYKHYTNGYTPNNLGIVPQVAEVWSGFVVNLSWSPYTHVVPFFLGFWCAYILAYNKFKKSVINWLKLGWFMSITCMIVINLSSHIWMAGYVDLDNQYLSTSYNIICSTLWAISFSWIVIACHYDNSSNLNKLLSLDIFVILSKASFIIYLSHMLVVRYYFGVQSTLMEVSRINFTYIITGNIIVSISFGVFLCIAFEGPVMKFQKMIIQRMNPNKKINDSICIRNGEGESIDKDVTNSNLIKKLTNK